MRVRSPMRAFRGLAAKCATDGFRESLARFRADRPQRQSQSVGRILSRFLGQGGACEEAASPRAVTSMQPIEARITSGTGLPIGHGQERFFDACVTAGSNLSASRKARAVDGCLKTDPKLSQNRPSRARSGRRLNARQDRGNKVGEGRRSERTARNLLGLLTEKFERRLEHRSAVAL